jgi:hypothetical protein
VKNVFKIQIEGNAKEYVKRKLIERSSHQKRYDTRKVLGDRAKKAREQLSMRVIGLRKSKRALGCTIRGDNLS